MLCVLILSISGGTYSLKSTPKDRFFEKLYMAVLLYSQSFCQKSAERKSPKFKVDSERQIFLKTFHGSFTLVSEFLPEIC